MHWEFENRFAEPLSTSSLAESVLAAPDGQLNLTKLRYIHDGSDGYGFNGRCVATVELSGEQLAAKSANFGFSIKKPMGKMPILPEDCEFYSYLNW